MLAPPLSLSWLFYFISTPDDCLDVNRVLRIILQFLSQPPDDIFHRSGPVSVLLMPGGFIELILTEHLPRSAGQEQEHGELSMVQAHLLPCFEHHPAVRVDLYCPQR